MRTYSKESYRHLIELALGRGYRFVNFLQGNEANGDGPVLYLRHDVDRSLSLAVELAKINAELGVSGTFCLLVRSANYNLLSHEGLGHAREIHSLNQHLALHYALPPELPEGARGLADSIRADFALAQSFLPEMQPVFSWHDPTPEVIARGLGLEVEGYVNTYHARLFKEVRYYSDSNRRYTVAEFEKFIEAGEPALQLLFHPLFWVVGGADLSEAWARVWKHIIFEHTAPALGTPEAAWRGFVEHWSRGAGEV